jgi:hypothetical protein
MIGGSLKPGGSGSPKPGGSGSPAAREAARIRAARNVNTGGFSFVKGNVELTRKILVSVKARYGARKIFSYKVDVNSCQSRAFLSCPTGSVLDASVR